MSEKSESNKLNLFRFASKRKGSNESHNKDPIEKLDTELPTIDTQANDDSYPPEHFYNQENQWARSPSEASLIFERSVEDPAQVFQQTTCPRCGSKPQNIEAGSPNSNGGLKCNHQSIVNLPSHYSVENFVSPCLDATTKILTDDSTDLDNVDMVYSRRPSSVLQLSMAMNRSNNVNDQASSPSSPRVNSKRTQSFANVKDFDSPSRPPVLSFYSYADMINNEQPNPRRPSISQSLSSSFLNSRSNSISNPAVGKFAAGNSITPQRSAVNSSRTSFSSPMLPGASQQQQQHRVPRIAKKFTLNSDTSPNSSEDDSDFNASLQKRHSISSRKSTSSKLSNGLKAPSRRNTGTSNIGPLSRTTSNQSSVVSGSSIGRRYSNLNEVSDNESLVISSIGETLRRNTGEISSN